jgi:hypothetical protein
MKIVKENRDDIIQEAKIFALLAPTFLPLLYRRMKEANGRLRQSFKSGKTDNLTIVAELSVLADLEDEINQKRMLYDTLAGEKS